MLNGNWLQGNIWMYNQLDDAAGNLALMSASSPSLTCLNTHLMTALASPTLDKTIQLKDWHHVIDVNSVPMTPFPVLASRCGKWPPTTESSRLVNTDEKLMTKICSIFMYDVYVTMPANHMICYFVTFNSKTRIDIAINFCAVSPLWGRWNSIDKTAQITSSVHWLLQWRHC
jgi:hypothetical protein